MTKDLTIKKAFNLTINRFETKRQALRLHSLPRTVDVVLTRACNLKCSFCKSYETTGAQYLSRENFEHVARQLFPAARIVRFCSGGEPYMHKRIIDLLRISRRYKVMTWVFSNGMLLSEDIIRTVVKEELISLHGFSVDGITPATVEAMRVNAKLNVIRKNIGAFVRIRREEGKNTPTVVIRYALMRSNIEELPDAVQQWGEMGIERIDCNYLSICNELDQQESLYFHQDLMEQVFQKCQTLAVRYPQLTLNLPPTIRQEQQFLENPKMCTAPWNFIRVETDGRILPCYKSWGVINMGNIFDNDGGSIREIWNTTDYQALRRTVNVDGPRKYYAYCAVCPSRFALGDLSAHLDTTWLDNAGLDPDIKANLIDHRGREKKHS